MKNFKIGINKHQFLKCLELSADRLKSAKILLDKGQYRDSISRSYYAFFDVVAALLATRGITTKTHVGALQKFSLYFVKTQLLPKEYGKKMRELLETRQEADYDWTIKFDKTDALDAYNEAREFLDFVSENTDNLFR